MKLVRFCKGSHWDVLGFVEDRGDCPVLDLVGELEGKRGVKLQADLEQYIPNSPCEQWTRTDLSKPLRDGIYEFRWTTKKGGTPRVLWFYDKGRVVVCTHGMNKKEMKTPDEDIDKAIECRSKYEAAQKANQLQIIERKEFDCEDES